MSFFGIDNNDLENEKRKYLEGNLEDDSDIPVYTWGTERYDGLTDVLQEGGDDLNDETFGGAGPVGAPDTLRSSETTADAIFAGKDYDFSQSAFFADDAPTKPLALEPRQNAFDRDPLLDSRPQLNCKSITRDSFIVYNFFPFTARQSQTLLDSRWDDRSVSSMLPRANGTVRSGTPSQHTQVQQVQQQLPSSSSARFSPFRAGEILHYESPLISHALPRQQPQGSFSSPQPGVARTLEEVEAEMRALTQRSRENVAIPRPTSYQQQQQQQQTQQHQLQQLQQLQQRNTPPPRLHPHSQSPRFHQQQQQVLLQQQQQLQQQLQQQQLQQLREQQLQEQQQLQELQELQDYHEQLQMEELEMRLRAQQLYQAQQQARAALHQRQASAGPTLTETQVAEQLLRRRQQQQSPAPFINDQLEAPFQQSMQYLPQDIQIQQRLLAEAAQLELLQQLKGNPNQVDQESLRAEAMRKIMEAERMEDKRRRRQAKVAHMVSLDPLPEYQRLMFASVKVQ
jgi:DNA topoisomerase 2-associated protein PAT1